MKLNLSLFGIWIVLSVGLTAQGQEKVWLWSSGEMPFQNEEEAGTEKPALPSLQLYSTDGRDNHSGAAVVICPGGGYGGLAIDHEGHQPAKWFNEQGVSAFVLHYRLGSQGYHYPAQLADVQRAIRYVRAHAAEYGLDPNRIAVMGFSAGGHLASMAATLYDREVYEAQDAVDEVSARPDFAVLCYPVISMDGEITHSGSRRNLLGTEKAGDERLAASVSSEKNVTAETPPTFLFQTDADTAVPAENAVRFYLALRENGVSAELHCYQDGPHGVGLYRGDPVLGTWSGLLANWLRASSFFSPSQPRLPLQGVVTLDGEPVSWGMLTFYPENEHFPITSIRVRRGKFAAPADLGPVAGKARISFEGSIWESTGDPTDESVTLDSLSPEDESPVELELKPGMEQLTLDYVSE
ncbi:MAG: alpha/beta hydrolase [Verrucomicrobiales bacterium]|nr:alpha/beta hydrolase [Verrucomicrobiales bacterium]